MNTTEVRFPECAKGRHEKCPGVDVNHCRRLVCDCDCHLPKAVKSGTLTLFGQQFTAHVLSDGTRIIENSADLFERLAELDCPTLQPGEIEALREFQLHGRL